MGDFGTIMAIAGAFAVVYFIFALIATVVSLLTIVAFAKIYEKAGYMSWKSVIPMYNLYILFKFTWGKGWLFLLMLLPVVNIVIWIITMKKLNEAFDGTLVSFILLILIPVIPLMMMAYDTDVEYVGDYGGDDDV